MKPNIRQFSLSLALGVGLWFLTHHQTRVWPFIVGIILILAVEMPWPGPTWTLAEEASPRILAALSTMLLVALYPGRAAEIGVIVVYMAWRTWLVLAPERSNTALIAAMGNQVLALEAIFVMAAIWNPWRIIILALTWVVSYLVALRLVKSEKATAAALLAAAWALVAAELAWVFTMWLVSYVLFGGNLIIPQPVIVLSGIGYCFGSIYVAQRQGKLSRSRLTEYLLIAAVLIGIVAGGTNWRGII